MVTRYLGVFGNNEYIRKLTLEELNDIENVEYMFKCVSEFELSKSKTYTLINRDGTRNRFTIGNFELVDIGEDSGAKRITYKDNRLNITFQKDAFEPGVTFLKKEVIPFMTKLHEVGSFEMYEKLKELDGANRKIALLQTTVSNLEATIKSLNSRN